MDKEQLEQEDYVGPGELTVTITLHEYRELLKHDCMVAGLVGDKIRLERRVRELQGKLGDAE